MADLHVIGQVLGATGFRGRTIFCKVRRQQCSPRPWRDFSIHWVVVSWTGHALHEISAQLKTSRIVFSCRAVGRDSWVIMGSPGRH